MSDTNNPNAAEKAAKIRRKPERESVLTPIFAAARQPASDRQQTQPSGNDLLQRQCSCGQHTIGGGVCEECQQKQAAASPTALDDLSPATPPDIQTTRDSTARFDLSNVPAQTRTTANGQPIQPALTVNAPGDQYEQEADRVAEAVMRMPAPASPSPSTEIDSFIHPTVSRLPAMSPTQTSDGNGAFQAPTSVENRISQMQGNGQAFPAEEQDFFEKRMGYDFSQVRVHTDANTVQASRDIQAQAFTVGNNIGSHAGTYQLNSSIVQRREPEEEETANNDTRPWDIPFDGGRAETYAEAIEGLDHIDSFIFFNSSSDMPEVWEEQLDSARDACWDTAQELKGKFGLLDPRDTTTLELLSHLTKNTWDEAVKDTRKKVESELKKIKSGYGLDSKIVDLQEKLHFGFIEGADEEHIKAIQETLTAVKEYKEKVDKVIGWAKDAASALKKAKALDFFKKLDEVSGKFGKVVGYAEQATEAAKIVYNLATQKGASGDFEAINAFEAGLDAIDFGMGFVKSVPVFGQLWSQYYSPMTRECLRLLREIAKYVDKRNRDLALLEWMRDGKKARMADGSPRIPEGLEPNFPGGQAVLSYMWHVCNSGGGTATGSVTSYFVDHADQFNAGVPDGGVKLRTEATWDWWNPFSWGNDDRVLNLDAFVAANKDMIWAMLYGSMPQNI